MNWTLVLIGNLIMDTAIVIFAVCSALEAKFWKLTVTSIIGKFITDNISTNNIRIFDKLTDIVSPVQGRLFIIIFILFVTGIILQVIGIFS